MAAVGMMRQGIAGVTAETGTGQHMTDSTKTADQTGTATASVAGVCCLAISLTIAQAVKAIACTVVSAPCAVQL